MKISPLVGKRSVARVLLCTFLLGGMVWSSLGFAAEQNTAQSQTLSIGTVQSVITVGASLWVISFKEHSFVAYTTHPQRVGDEVMFEILRINDIEGKPRLVAFIMTPRK